MTGIRLIGVPMDLGASRRGVDMGPFAVRYTDLRERLERLGHTIEDLGKLGVPLACAGMSRRYRDPRSSRGASPSCWAVTTPWRPAPSPGRRPFTPRATSGSGS